MPSNIINLDAQNIAHNLTLNVTITRMDQWRWRIALGSWLIRLAAWVMWVDVEFNTDGE